ncbi:MAG: PhzF family phenazine biosynthesis protein [Ignavibacteria bacterium]|nr:PhzF family phenazine biosynthesis protein [Ignavibacteria bacterium]
MKIPLYQVDAFTNKVFSGNPAAVCPLEKWTDDTTMQKIAAENNLSETAFFVKKDKDLYELRWFTPTMEVDLCGHATLASAFVIFNFINKNISSVSFETKSGKLKVERTAELLSLDFPARDPIPYQPEENISAALGLEPMEILRSRDLFVVYKNESQIISLSPNFELLKTFKDFLGIIVTAPGNGYDFCSRFFAPNAGILEDPVTGSAHCSLIPYWSKQLNKNKLHAFQLSQRRGELFCENLGDRVKISGNAVLYLEGEILI